MTNCAKNNVIEIFSKDPNATNVIWLRPGENPPVQVSIGAAGSDTLAGGYGNAVWHQSFSNTMPSVFRCFSINFSGENIALRPLSSRRFTGVRPAYSLRKAMRGA